MVGFAVERSSRWICRRQ